MTSGFAGAGAAAVVAIENARPTVISPFAVRILSSIAVTGGFGGFACVGVEGGNKLSLSFGELGGKGLDRLSESDHGGAVGGGGGGEFSDGVGGVGL